VAGKTGTNGLFLEIGRERDGGSERRRVKIERRFKMEWRLVEGRGERLVLVVLVG
jgi:hypothetical protein